MKQIFSRPVNSSSDLSRVKHAMEIGDAQLHRLYSDECADPYVGVSELHDQCTAAFNAIKALDREIRERAAAIFASHGLQDHGFMAYVAVGYDRATDKY